MELVGGRLDVRRVGGRLNFRTGRNWLRFAVSRLPNVGLQSKLVTSVGVLEMSEVGTTLARLDQRLPAVWYNRRMEVPMTITTEMKQAVERAGVEPVRVEDPGNGTSYVLIREDVYQQMRELVALESSDRELDVYQEPRHANP